MLDLVPNIGLVEQFYSLTNTFNNFHHHLQQTVYPISVDYQSLTCNMVFSDASVLDITYDSSLDSIKYTAQVVQTSYLGFGYGTQMTGNDLVMWIANGLLNSN